MIIVKSKTEKFFKKGNASKVQLCLKYCELPHFLNASKWLNVKTMAGLGGRRVQGVGSIMSNPNQVILEPAIVLQKKDPKGFTWKLKPKSV